MIGRGKPFTSGVYIHNRTLYCLPIASAHSQEKTNLLATTVHLECYYNVLPHVLGELVFTKLQEFIVFKNISSLWIKMAIIQN